MYSWEYEMYEFSWNLGDFSSVLIMSSSSLNKIFSSKIWNILWYQTILTSFMSFYSNFDNMDHLLRIWSIYSKEVMTSGNFWLQCSFFIVENRAFSNSVLPLEYLREVAYFNFSLTTSEIRFRVLHICLYVFCFEKTFNIHISYTHTYTVLTYVTYTWIEHFPLNKQNHSSIFTNQLQLNESHDIAKWYYYYHYNHYQHQTNWMQHQLIYVLVIKYIYIPPSHSVHNCTLYLCIPVYVWLLRVLISRFALISRWLPYECVRLYLTFLLCAVIVFICI